VVAARGRSGGGVLIPVGPLGRGAGGFMDNKSKFCHDEQRESYSSPKSVRGAVCGRGNLGILIYPQVPKKGCISCSITMPYFRNRRVPLPHIRHMS
jgi:hypothetical protein